MNPGRGRHERVAPDLPWHKRPRPPFRLDGFTVRFVVIPLVLAPVAVIFGISALADGRATGAVQIAVGALLLTLTGLYFSRPLGP